MEHPHGVLGDFSAQVTSSCPCPRQSRTSGLPHTSGPLPGRPFISSSARPFTQLLAGSSRGRGSWGTDLTLDEAGEGVSHWLQTLVPETKK